VNTNEHAVTAMNDVSCDWSKIAVREQLLLKVASVLFALASLVLTAIVVIYSVDAFVGSKFGAAVALVAVLAVVNTGIVVAAAIAEHFEAQM
jgi:hypothetical protein